LAGRGEVAHHGVGLVVREPEGRHPQTHPGPDRRRGLHEVEEPGGLHLLALAVEDRRGERRLLLVEASDVAAVPLDHVAARTVVARDPAPAVDHLTVAGPPLRVARPPPGVAAPADEHPPGLAV